MRYLPGLVLAQMVTGLLVWLNHDQLLQISGLLNVVLPSLAVSVVAGFWLGALSRRRNAQDLAAAAQRHHSEREELRLKAEQEKAHVQHEAERAKAHAEREAHKAILRETRRTHARANLKVGVALTGAVAFGVMMMFTQLASLGLILLSGAGGALAGYLAQLRRRTDHAAEKQMEVIPPTTPKILRIPSLQRLIRRS
ncbi:MAG: hypothetical protein AAF950_16955 [Pseudomonadota bacterium]